MLFRNNNSNGNFFIKVIPTTLTPGTTTTGMQVVLSNQTTEIGRQTIGDRFGQRGKQWPGEAIFGLGSSGSGPYTVTLDSGGQTSVFDNVIPNETFRPAFPKTVLSIYRGSGYGPGSECSRLHTPQAPNMPLIASTYEWPFVDLGANLPGNDFCYKVKFSNEFLSLRVGKQGDDLVLITSGGSNYYLAGGSDAESVGNEAGEFVSSFSGGRAIDTTADPAAGEIIFFNAQSAIPGKPEVKISGIRDGNDQRGFSLQR